MHHTSSFIFLLLAVSSFHVSTGLSPVDSIVSQHFEWLKDSENDQQSLEVKQTSPVEVDPVPMQSPTGRSNCAYLFDKKYQWHDRSNLVQMAFYLFLSLPNSKDDIQNAKSAGTHGTLEKLMDIVSSWQHFQVTALQIDEINGRTIAMKLAQLGLAKLIEKPFASNYLYTRDTIPFKDIDGNNLIHLAAMSEDTATVEAILLMLYTKAKMQPKDIVILMQEKNKSNKTPIEVACEASHLSLAVTNNLKAFYSTAKFFAAFQSKAADELGQPIVPV